MLLYQKRSKVVPSGRTAFDGNKTYWGRPCSWPPAFLIAAVRLLRCLWQPAAGGHCRSPDRCLRTGANSPHGRKSGKPVTIVCARAQKRAKTNGQEGRPRLRADRFFGEEAGQRALCRRAFLREALGAVAPVGVEVAPSLWHNCRHVDVSNAHIKKSHKLPCVRHKTAASQDRLAWHAGTPSAFAFFSY